MSDIPDYNKLLAAINDLKNSMDINAIQAAIKTLTTTGVNAEDVKNLLSADDLTNMTIRLASVEKYVTTGKPGTYLFYSGEINGVPAYQIAEKLGDKYITVQKTPLGKLLNDIDIADDVGKNLCGGFESLLDLYPNQNQSVWDEMSRGFANHATGAVEILAPQRKSKQRFNEG